jgi:hypothetical protein
VLLNLELIKVQSKSSCMRPYLWAWVLEQALNFFLISPQVPKPAQNRRAQSSASVGPVPSSLLVHSDREQVKACGLGHPQDLSPGPNPMLSGELNWVHGVFSWF